jgi:hypothetical protein
MHVHLKPIDVALARAQADTEVLRAIEQCPRCRAAAHRVDEWMELADHSDPLVAAEIEMGHLRLENLRSLALGEAVRRIREDPEYHRWGVTRLVLLSARRLGRRGATADRIQRAFRLAILGFELAPRLDPHVYGSIPWLRINLQVMETGFQVLATVADTKGLDRARERTFRRIYALLETLATLE